MKKSTLYILCIITSFQAYTCIVPETVHEVTRTLSERNALYENRRAIVNKCVLTGVALCVGYLVYTWHTKPVLDGSQDALLQQAAADHNFKKNLVDIYTKHQARAILNEPSWLWKKCETLGSFVVNNTIAVAAGTAIQHVLAQGGGFLHPRVTRTVLSSPYLSTLYRTMSETEQLASISVPLDVDFFITQVDLLECAVQQTDHAMLVDSAHGILGYTDYALERMKHDSETSFGVIRQLERIRGILAEQLEKLYGYMIAEKKEQTLIWSAHEDSIATVAKLRAFEPFRI